MERHGIYESFRTIFRLLPPGLKRQFYGLLALMLMGAAAELLAIGAIVPFLTILADPGKVWTLPSAVDLLSLFGVDTNSEVAAFAALIFAIAAVVAGLIRLWLLWVQQSFVFGVAHHLGVEIHQRILYQSYTYHLTKNTSEVIASLEKVQVLLFNVLVPLMAAFSSAVIGVFITAVLVYIDPVAAIAAALAFSSVYVVVSLLSRQRLARSSETINSAYSRRVQAVQEGLGGIRDIIIERSQPLYVREFAAIDGRFRRAQAIAAFIGGAPRFAVEAAGMVLIALLAMLLVGRTGGLVAALPVLGALALGAQRLLPLIQLVYYGWSSLAAGRAMLADLINLLQLPMPERADFDRGVSALSFERELRLDRVEFAYSENTEPVLSDISLVIPAGSSVALIGKTGSGKSTLVDLIMGLLEPQRGTITVDGIPLLGDARRGWHSRIAHVPQSVFLADTTIERNIAFGAPEAEIDRARVETAARLAQLHEHIQTLPEGYQTSVGERGVRLSGGQRQRLGIARALYKQASVLVLDEATSALDEETEAAVMRGLRELGESPTVIMIAHRLSTVAHCDKVVRLSRGRIVSIGSYEQVVRGTDGQTSLSFAR